MGFNRIFSKKEFVRVPCGVGALDEVVVNGPGLQEVKSKTSTSIDHRSVDSINTFRPRIGKPQKKVPLLMAGQLRPIPPPTRRMAVGTVEKKVQKVYWPAPSPPPPHLYGPAIFAASLTRRRPALGD